MNKVSIAVVDDHDLFREGLMLLISQIPGYRVLFDADNGEAFLEKLDTYFPDIVLMDFSMPRMDGPTATAKALLMNPDIKIIALTMFSDHHHYSQMAKAGARGFILKNCNKQELCQAINEVSGGGSYFSKEILNKKGLKTLDAGPSIITLRELEILHLVCSGMTSTEIADKLSISAKTVEGHRTNIFQKTKVRNSTELLLWAIRNKYLTVEP